MLPDKTAGILVGIRLWQDHFVLCVHCRSYVKLTLNEEALLIRLSLSTLRPRNYQLVSISPKSDHLTSI
jgi:hypothetical protein